MSTGTIRDFRSAHDHGPYSAYCQVCWNPVYTLWIDKESHGGRCMFGETCASRCPDALGRAVTTRNLMAAKAASKGLVSKSESDTDNSVA